jgi:hypothetical protein
VGVWRHLGDATHTHPPKRILLWILSGPFGGPAAGRLAGWEGKGQAREVATLVCVLSPRVSGVWWPSQSAGCLSNQRSHVSLSGVELAISTPPAGGGRGAETTTTVVEKSVDPIAAPRASTDHVRVPLPIPLDQLSYQVIIEGRWRFEQTPHCDADCMGEASCHAMPRTRARPRFINVCSITHARLTDHNVLPTPNPVRLDKRQWRCGRRGMRS